jgi:hypothetical protein
VLPLPLLLAQRSSLKLGNVGEGFAMNQPFHRRIAQLRGSLHLDTVLLPRSRGSDILLKFVSVDKIGNLAYELQ